MVRQTIKVGGIDGLALTKLDVLDGFAEIKSALGMIWMEKTGLLSGITNRAGESHANLRNCSGMERVDTGSQNMGGSSSGGD